MFHISSKLKYDMGKDGEKKKKWDLGITFNFSKWKAGLMIFLCFAHSSSSWLINPLARNLTNGLLFGFLQLKLFDKTSFTSSGSMMFTLGLGPNHMNELFPTRYTKYIKSRSRASKFLERVEVRKTMKNMKHTTKCCISVHNTHYFQRKYIQRCYSITNFGLYLLNPIECVPEG